MLIDEVMGVGVGRFRQKAASAMVNKMNTRQMVVLVFHIMTQVDKLCDRVLWLKAGKVKMIGTPKLVLSEYKQFLNQR